MFERRNEMKNSLPYEGNVEFKMRNLPHNMKAYTYLYLVSIS